MRGLHYYNGAYTPRLTHATLPTMSTHLFYFVRHGQSILNAKGIRQGSIGQLSDKGVEQAHITGERLAEEQSMHGKIQKILCSPYDRTRETADIINMHIHVAKPIEYNPLLGERRNPSEIVGHSIDEPEVKKIVNIIDHSYHDDTYRFSDEENFIDLRDRAKACLAYLESQKEKRVLVVTHGIFLKMLIAYILHRDELTAVLYNKLSFFNPANNAGITVCQLTKGILGTKIAAPKPKDAWKLIVWDDHIDLKGKNTTI